MGKVKNDHGKQQLSKHPVSEIGQDREKESQVIRRCRPDLRNHAQGPEVRLTSGSLCQGAAHPSCATRRTPHGASRLVQAMFSWSVKTRRAPSRPCGDARVSMYGTTDYSHGPYDHPPPSTPHLYGVQPTAMHEMSTPPPPTLRFSNHQAHLAVDIRF